MGTQPPATASSDHSVILPADHAFVVQLRAGSGGGAGGPWQGRVEHVESGQATRFDDWTALRAFIITTLHNRTGTDDIEDPGPTL